MKLKLTFIVLDFVQFLLLLSHKILHSLIHQAQYFNYENSLNFDHHRIMHHIKYLQLSHSNTFESIILESYF
jgi:hypothetical protein